MASSEIESQVPVNAGDYHGYVPKTNADFEEIPLETCGLLEAQEERDIEDAEAMIDPELLGDRAGVDRGALVGVIVTSVAFLIVILVIVIDLDCKLGLCDKIDRSSTENADNTFMVYEFVAPLEYVWAALSGALLGLLVISLLSFLLLKKDVGTPRMVEVATYIRKGAQTFLKEQYKYLLLALVPLFILIGFGASWRMAGCYCVGSVLSAISGWIGMSIATRGNVRAASASQLSVSDGLNVAFRTGSVMGLGIVSLGLGGLAVSYLIFRDVRALVGFSAGASTVALFARVAGGIFCQAADMGASQIGKIEAGVPEDDPRNPASITENVGNSVSDVAGAGADLFESYVGSVVATAILGSSLPYFYQSSYAMCVFNHVYIDQICKGYLAPTVKVSFAAQICRTESFHTEYPTLTTWSSNSTFVVIPFLLCLVGILASALTTLHVFVSKNATAGGDNEERSKLMRLLLRALRLNVFVATLLVVIGAAGLCWGLLGSKSTFYKQNVVDDLPRWELAELNATNAESRCLPTSVIENVDDSNLPLLTLGSGIYRPLDSFGKEYPNPSQTPWRVFLCILLGLTLGLIIEWLTEYFTAGTYKPTLGIAEAGEFGAGATIIQGLGIGMLSTVVPLVLVITVILGSYTLFGGYGVSLSAVGMLSTLGITMSTSAYGAVADDAGGIAKMARMPREVRDTTDALDALGNTTSTTGKGFASASAVLTAYALLTSVVQDSGLVPSPRQIGGTAAINPARHITDFDELSLVDIYVIAATFFGVLLPYIFGAMTLMAVSRAAQRMTTEVRRQFQEIPGLREGNRSVQPDHERCARIVSRSAIGEMTLPGLLTILGPLIVGFGLGQRALVGMLVGAIGSGYMLGALMCNAGGAWDNARKLVEAGTFGPATGSVWHESAVAGDAVGGPLKDSAGPAMNILVKLMATFSLIAVPLMTPGPSRVWLGAGLFFGGAAAAVVLVLLLRRKGDDNPYPEEFEPAKGSKQFSLPSEISPFYEDGPSIARETISPRSELGIARRRRDVVPDVHVQRLDSMV